MEARVAASHTPRTGQFAVARASSLKGNRQNARYHTSNSFELLPVVGSLGIRARGHGDDHIFTLFVIHIFDAQLQVILLDAKLGLLADGQKSWMFVIFGTNSVVDTLGLQRIFLAEQGTHFLVGVISADDFAGKTLVAFLVGAAIHRVHLQDGAALRRSMVAGVGK
jgi:hypothetical protein